MYDPKKPSIPPRFAPTMPHMIEQQTYPPHTPPVAARDVLTARPIKYYRESDGRPVIVHGFRRARIAFLIWPDLKLEDIGVEVPKPTQ
jgi:hypothetical protein